MYKMKLLLSAVLVAGFVMSGSLAFAGETQDTFKHASKSQSANKLNSASEHVDLNKADVSMLTQVKGIGPKKAAAIVTYREQHGNFKSVQDLAEVKGFGEKSLSRILKNNPNRLVINP